MSRGGATPLKGRRAEEKATQAFLSQFKTAAVSAEIVDRAGALYRKWNPSHGIEVNDALLAATAMETGGRLFCVNTRHYPMPDILVEHAWEWLLAQSPAGRFREHALGWHRAVAGARTWRNRACCATVEKIVAH
ncbi:MAG TPA: PIN domain-containing protein, partial [Deferrisomatales bacterium]|nr:PIN domain-containing protein [Deferrisomatales bacterium]